MKIEIWSDIICPFCYIGLTKLEMALQESANKPAAEIIWKSYQLNPDYPEDAPAIPTYDYLVQTKGMSIDDVVAMTSQLSAQGRELGIALNFDKAVVVNTRKAHRLIHFAQGHQKGTPIKKALFKAHFTDGLNINDNQVLTHIATQYELPAYAIQNLLESDEFAYDVAQDIQEGVNLGLRGVPFFVFDRKYAIPGAQPMEVFNNTINECLASQSAPLQQRGEEGPSCDPETGKCE
ncbi:DsbA family oxidoreductase [Sphingobacterium sp. 2149]|uniref:DsbA family oxidoreductase n=1 Tax=Sphingobacterium sp. 2149 TaxID=2817763 RepID=UPI001AE650C8|nr:DsbA family oxidoreductase [Sphingobacterium sp. 2149]MDR6734678.1 putative DsbA family dithiol-disulfide isomerase [Sphingobacterium sp. 2149]